MPARKHVGFQPRTTVAGDFVGNAGGQGKRMAAALKETRWKDLRIYLKIYIIYIKMSRDVMNTMFKAYRDTQVLAACLSAPVHQLYGYTVTTPELRTGRAECKISNSVKCVRMLVL